MANRVNEDLVDFIKLVIRKGIDGSLEGKDMKLSIDNGPWLAFGVGGTHDVHYALYCPGPGQVVTEGEIEEMSARFLADVFNDRSETALVAKAYINDKRNPRSGFLEVRSKTGEIQNPDKVLAPGQPPTFNKPQLPEIPQERE